MNSKTTHNYEQRLLQRGIRPSPVRLLVMRTLCQTTSPLSVLEIETELQTVDRSSVTRAIAVFQEAGITHAISDGSGSVKYELCPSHDQHTPSDEHVHFHCELCGRTICLTDTSIPEINLPDGFKAREANFVIVGTCDKCQKRLT